MATTLKMGTLQISSPAFENHGPIPRRYTSDGDDVSPPLRWMGVPPGTKELALVCFDPDAPMPRMFTHWVVYRIPPNATSIGEGESGKNQLTEGTNGSGTIGYTGPAPPPAHGLHHYYFCLYALDTNLDSLVQAGLTREQLMEEISKHVIQMARLVGTYEKQ
jgi:Raf kinase inhibitor-like YbhB/YbcL family protein